MPRGIRNWTYHDIIEFLRYNGFTFFEERAGSHEAWISEDKKSIVEVNFKSSNKSYPPLTMKTMIGQSSIDEEVWRNWAMGKKLGKPVKEK